MRCVRFNQKGRQHRRQRPQMASCAMARGARVTRRGQITLPAHILEGYIGVHGRRDRGRAMAKLLLDLPEVAGFLEQMDRQGVPGRMDAQFRRQTSPLYSHFPDPFPDLAPSTVHGSQ